MPEPLTLVMREFLSWVARCRRAYAEAMEAWRSSCPRLTVWEDALLGGLIQIDGDCPLDTAAVTLTERGSALLAAQADQR